MPTNLPTTKRVGEQTSLPSTFVMPIWCKGLVIGQAVRSFRVEEVRTRRVGRFDMRGLMPSPIASRFPTALKPESLLPTIRKEHPIDGTEIVGWMHTSIAENATLQARIQEYNRAKPASYATGDATDPRYPGLTVEDMKIQSDSGHTVRRRGYAIASAPEGNYNVPFPEKATGIFGDKLSWGSTSAAGAVQWNASLLKWTKLAETPISEKIGFYMDGRGNQAPHFFAQAPRVPKPRVSVKQVFDSEEPQTIVVRQRDPTDYTRVISENNVDLDEGSNEVSYEVTAFPYVPPTVAEIQPEDNKSTTISSYTVA